jgi:hypothetical protein
MIQGGIGGDLLWIPFLYFFSLRSNIVYLSLGSISASVGISAFHRSINLIVPIFLAWSAVMVTVPIGRLPLRISPCFGPLPCRRSLRGVLTSAFIKRWPWAVWASSSVVAWVAPIPFVAVVAGCDWTCLWRALSRTETMLSTRRRRRRWRSFCGAESRHGIFLQSRVSGVGSC